MEQVISEIFSQYAYAPLWVYSAIIIFMFLSSFGMPIPEEVVLISSGIVGYMSLNPEQFPPPFPGAPKVNVYTLATVSLLAVMGSDFLIYVLGRKYGSRIVRKKFFSRMVNNEMLAKIQRWTHKYGYWAVLIFRFTPGLRFPGHLMCGAMGLTPVRFLGVDFIAAGFSVPTQVLLISLYGEIILQSLAQFKFYALAILGLSFLSFVLYKLRLRRSRLYRQQPE